MRRSSACPDSKRGLLRPTRRQVRQSQARLRLRDAVVALRHAPLVGLVRRPSVLKRRLGLPRFQLNPRQFEATPRAFGEVPSHELRWAKIAHEPAVLFRPSPRRSPRTPSASIGAGGSLRGTGRAVRPTPSGPARRLGWRPRGRWASRRRRRPPTPLKRRPRRAARPVSRSRYGCVRPPGVGGGRFGPSRPATRRRSRRETDPDGGRCAYTRPAPRPRGRRGSGLRGSTRDLQPSRDTRDTGAATCSPPISPREGPPRPAVPSVPRIPPSGAHPASTRLARCARNCF